MIWHSAGISAEENGFLEPPGFPPLPLVASLPEELPASAAADEAVAWKKDSRRLVVPAACAGRSVGMLSFHSGLIWYSVALSPAASLFFFNLRFATSAALASISCVGQRVRHEFGI